VIHDFTVSRLPRGDGTFGRSRRSTRPQRWGRSASAMR
jgi:hypothetical protein